MADIRSFRGFRYDLGRVGSLSDVVAPPYDVVDAALYDKLTAASDYNAIRVELPTDPPAGPPGNEGGADKYTRAARLFNGWLADGVVQQDSARSLYVVEQEFTTEGVTHVRRGFLARVRLEPLATGNVFAHEQTMAGPKADRLKLYQATGFNFSPVFGLYPDDDGEAMAKLLARVKNAPPTTAIDHLGTVNRLWPVTDQATISQVIGVLGPKPIFIADGHHRYETALKHRDEQAALGRLEDDESPANFCLMMLVAMSDPGLIVLPTHRVLDGLPAGTSPELQALLAADFTVIEEYGPDAAACWERVQLEGSQAVLGFGTAADGNWFAARHTTPERVAALAPEHSPEWCGLAVSVLHKLVIEKLLAEKYGTAPTCRYGHLLSEVTDALTSGAGQVGVLVPAVGVQHVEWLAGERETMPPKSTYFAPKQLTGLVFHSLKRE